MYKVFLIKKKCGEPPHHKHTHQEETNQSETIIILFTV
jgi:hypothetical protein